MLKLLKETCSVHKVDHVADGTLQKYAFGHEKENLALLCGPPAMIQKAVLPALREIGYKEDENLFGF